VESEEEEGKAGRGEEWQLASPEKTTESYMIINVYEALSGSSSLCPSTTALGGGVWRSQGRSSPLCR
jgi:hypothetical protein